MEAQAERHEHRARQTARPEKVQQVEAIRRWLKTAAATILTDYRGLNVAEMAQLRSKLREAGTEYRVVKNTLLARAASEMGLTGLEAFLKGPTAVAISREDPVGPARVLQEFIRQMRKLEVKGGLVEGRVLSADQVRMLADMPGKSQMRARVLGTLQGPLSALAAVLSGLPRNLVYTLEQVRRQREAA